MNKKYCIIFIILISYLIGALLYITGGILSEFGLPGFSYCWLFGSILFWLGGTLGLYLEMIR